MKEDVHTMQGKYNCEMSEYERGINEAWVAFKEVLELSPYERNYLFGYEEPKYIVRMFEPKEVMEIMKNRKEEVDQIDEIIAILKKRGIDIDKEELFSLYGILREHRAYIEEVGGLLFRQESV